MKFNLEEKKKRKWKNGLSITPFITQKKDAGDVEKGIENFNALMSTGSPTAAMGENLNKENKMEFKYLHERINEDAFQLDKDFSVEDLIGFVKVNAPYSKEEEKPAAKECMINEINIPDNMRFKDWDIDAIGDDVLQLNWTTQEPFTSEDSEKFIAEIKRFFEALVRREEFHKPFTVALEVMSRSLDEDDGHLVYDIKINEKENEEMNLVKEDLNNVTEVEDKSREVVDPAFADAVREIRSHDEERAEAKKVMKAPKEGEESLPKDLKMNLDESLFTEWVEDVEVLNRIKSPVNDDVELSADMKLRDAYTAYEPEEFQLDRLRNDITLKEVWEKMKAGEDIYELASVDGKGFDSAVREGIFVMLEMVLGIDYDTIYDTWLYPEMKESCSKEMNESEEVERIAKTSEEYLDDIRMSGGWAAVEKIEFDTDYETIDVDDVLNKALASGWRFVNHPEHGLCIVAKGREIEDE